MKQWLRTWSSSPGFVAAQPGATDHRVWTDADVVQDVVYEYGANISDFWQAWSPSKSQPIEPKWELINTPGPQMTMCSFSHVGHIIFFSVIFQPMVMLCITDLLNPQMNPKPKVFYAVRGSMSFFMAPLGGSEGHLRRRVAVCDRVETYKRSQQNMSRAEALASLPTVIQLGEKTWKLYEASGAACCREFARSSNCKTPLKLWRARGMKRLCCQRRAFSHKR